MSEVPLNEELSFKVFNNPVIVENIIDDPILILLYTNKLRLVNKIFNEICMKLNRIKNRKIEIEFNEKTTGEKNEMSDYVHLNRRAIRKNKISQHFNFINKAYKVEVEEIRVKNIWKLKPEVAKEFHDSIHKNLIGNNGKSVRTLVGLEEVCNGCEDCLDIAQNSKVYGPIGFEIISKIQHHFEEIIITDRLLEQIANYCVQGSPTKNECYKKLDTVINPSISCDCLILKIHEGRIIKGQKKKAHSQFPWEILELMLEKWNAKSLNFRFTFSFQKDFCNDQWSNSDYFSGIKLNEKYEKIEKKKSKKKLENITIDFTDSVFCRQDFEYYQPDRVYYSGYDNLIANIRRIFSIDKLNLDFLSFRWPYVENIPKIFNNLIRIFRMDYENTKNLQVKIKSFLQLYVWDEEIHKTTKEYVKKTTELIQIPKIYIMEPDEIKCTHREILLNSKDGYMNFIVLNWSRKRLRLLDNNIQLNMDLYINTSKKIEQQVSEEQSDMNCFLVHFRPELFPLEG